MTTKNRRPGDQAPPPRAAHRNEHIKTASTHIKDTAGKLFCVHDGSTEKNILRHPDGRAMTLLSYEDAKRAKDVAVTRLKQRKATIAELDIEATGAPIDADLGVEIGGGAHAASVGDSFVSPSAQLADPALEANRQRAVAAARPVATQAQRRADAVQRAPGWEPAPKAQPATGKAPGWTPPPAGVSSARKASEAQAQGRAAGWEKPEAGKTAAPPTAKAEVTLDDPNAPADEGDADVSDLLINPDLETDVKAETERAMEAAQKAWSALSPEEQVQVRAQVVRVATDGEREKMYAAMDPVQIGIFEALEQAYHLLFGIPAVSASPAEAKAP